MNDMLNNPVLIALIAAVPSFLLGYLAYRRSIEVDRVTEQSGVANTQLTAVGQVITGLNQLIDNLQADNKELRETIKTIAIKLKEVVDERDKLVAEVNNLNKTIKVNGK